MKNNRECLNGTLILLLPSPQPKWYKKPRKIISSAGEIFNVFELSHVTLHSFD